MVPVRRNVMTPGTAAVDTGGGLIDLSYFWTEGCGTFALVLAEQMKRKGLDARVVVASRQGGERWSEQLDFECTHVMVRANGGYWDVNGLAEDAEDALRRIGLITPCETICLHGPFSCSSFELSFMGDDEKPLYAPDAQTRSWAERIISIDPKRFGVGP